MRPVCLPAAASRRLRLLVARGNMPYSAVTQPSPVFFKNGGALSSIVAEHNGRRETGSYGMGGRWLYDTLFEPESWNAAMDTDAVIAGREARHGFCSDTFSLQAHQESVAP